MCRIRQNIGNQEKTERPMLSRPMLKRFGDFTVIFIKLQSVLFCLGKNVLNWL